MNSEFPWNPSALAHSAEVASATKAEQPWPLRSASADGTLRPSSAVADFGRRRPGAKTTEDTLIHPRPHGQGFLHTGETPKALVSKFFGRHKRLYGITVRSLNHFRQWEKTAMSHLRKLFFHQMSDGSAQAVQRQLKHGKNAGDDTDSLGVLPSPLFHRVEPDGVAKGTR